MKGRAWIGLSAEPQANLISRCLIRIDPPLSAGCLVVVHFTDIEPVDARVGEVLAEYAVIYANGNRQRWQIRRHFEINARYPSLGVRGYATVSHTEVVPVHRPRADRDGLTGQTHSGGRVTATGEILRMNGPQYWLWAGELVTGSEPIVAVELTALTPEAVAVAGVTLARDQANPLRHSPRTGIHVQLSLPNDLAHGSSTALVPDFPANRWSIHDASLGVDLAVAC